MIASPGPSLLRWIRYATCLVFSCLTYTFPCQVTSVLGRAEGKSPCSLPWYLCKAVELLLRMLPGSTSHHALVSTVYSWLSASMSYQGLLHSVWHQAFHFHITSANKSVLDNSCLYPDLVAYYCSNRQSQSSSPWVPFWKHCLYHSSSQGNGNAHCLWQRTENHRHSQFHYLKPPVRASRCITLMPCSFLRLLWLSGKVSVILD